MERNYMHYRERSMDYETVGTQSKINYERILFSETKINSIINYANEDPKANNELKLYKATHKARQCL